MTDTNLTVIGNLTDAPELKFSPSGMAIARFRVASTPRVKDKASGNYVDGEPLFLSCSVFREMAEHVAETLDRGSRVILSGRLKARTYDTRDGEKKTVMEVDVEEIGPSLRYATAKVTKAQRGGGNAQPAAQATGEADPWSTGSAPVVAATGQAQASTFDDSPPF